MPDRRGFREANFWNVDLGEADLSGADLRNTSVSQSNLSGANLTNANLVNANLKEVNLRKAKLDSMAAGWTVFLDVDLSEATGLDAVFHMGPSYVGIDTIYRSGGNIPEIFLRGAGVPENFITYMKSLAGTAIEFYSCFISYSTRDQEFAERLYADLQANNVRCWFAAHDIKGGRKIHDQIDDAIRVHDKLLRPVSGQHCQPVGGNGDFKGS